MNNETGGPAFPRNGLFHQDTLVRERCEIEPQEGMTLRDYFAAKAMQGLCSPYEYLSDNDIPEFAKSAYAIADAMLAERNK